jgi:DNA-binding MarR family transcriptional regulator/GNAT superfamily N-acetyltransferase
MDRMLVARVRSFNRTVTERIGALSDRFLGRARSLGEARLLWEIGTRGADVRGLRGRLVLDSAYLSRLLRSLERQGLITMETSPGDRRIRRVRLTDAGLHEREELEQRSDELARSLLEPLSEKQRITLTEAMATVERLLLASMVRIETEDPRSPDARWCLSQYYNELDGRFDVGFDPTRSLTAEARELTPPSGLLLLARLREQPVGCGALRVHPDGSAELKRMWVAADVRGLGVGRRLLGELEQHAANVGVSTIRLETNRSLTEAIALYRSSGYREVEAFNIEPYADHWFVKPLSGPVPRAGSRPSRR